MMRKNIGREMSAGAGIKGAGGVGICLQVVQVVQVVFTGKTREEMVQLRRKCTDITNESKKPCGAVDDIDGTTWFFWIRWLQIGAQCPSPRGAGDEVDLQRHLFAHIGHVG